ncbi:MAG: hypothetical protein Q8P05_00605 [Candidatus Diapherotrites archaeon]|nr:hypothetical protein [Candidatus Diapherotrites archaeon]
MPSPPKEAPINTIRIRSTYNTTGLVALAMAIGFHLFILIGALSREHFSSPIDANTGSEVSPYLFFGVLYVLILGFMEVGIHLARASKTMKVTHLDTSHSSDRTLENVQILYHDLNSKFVGIFMIGGMIFGLLLLSIFIFTKPIFITPFALTIFFIPIVYFLILRPVLGFIYRLVRESKLDFFTYPAFWISIGLTFFGILGWAAYGIISLPGLVAGFLFVVGLSSILAVIFLANISYRFEGNDLVIFPHYFTYSLPIIKQAEFHLPVKDILTYKRITHMEINALIQSYSRKPAYLIHSGAKLVEYWVLRKTDKPLLYLANGGRENIYLAGENFHYVISVRNADQLLSRIAAMKKRR